MVGWFGACLFVCLFVYLGMGMGMGCGWVRWMDEGKGEVVILEEEKGGRTPEE